MAANPNQAGANGPSPGIWTPDGSGYSDRTTDARNRAGAPTAGQQETAGMLATPEQAAATRSQPRTQAAGQQPEPVIPAAPQAQAPNPVREVWQALAADPDASPLIRWYASKGSNG